MQPLIVHRKASTRNLFGAKLIVLVLTCAAAAELLVGTTIFAAPDMENVAACLATVTPNSLESNVETNGFDT